MSVGHVAVRRLCVCVCLDHPLNIRGDGGMLSGRELRMHLRRWRNTFGCLGNHLLTIGVSVCAEPNQLEARAAPCQGHRPMISRYSMCRFVSRRLKCSWSWWASWALLLSVVVVQQAKKKATPQCSLVAGRSNLPKRVVLGWRVVALFVTPWALRAMSEARPNEGIRRDMEKGLLGRFGLRREHFGSAPGRRYLPRVGINANNGCAGHR